MAIHVSKNINTTFRGTRIKIGDYCGKISLGVL